MIYTDVHYPISEKKNPKAISTFYLQFQDQFSKKIVTKTHTFY